MVAKSLEVGYLPYTVGKQPSIALINRGRKWTLNWWWWSWFSNITRMFRTSHAIAKSYYLRWQNFWWGFLTGFSRSTVLVICTCAVTFTYSRCPGTFVKIHCPKISGMSISGLGLQYFCNFHHRSISFTINSTLTFVIYLLFSVFLVIFSFSEHISGLHI